VQAVIENLAEETTAQKVATKPSPLSKHMNQSLGNLSARGISYITISEPSWVSIQVDVILVQKTISALVSIKQIM